MPSVCRGLEYGVDVGWAKEWLRWCAIGLLISAGVVALGYTLVGHPLIQILYEGSTGTFLDGIITGQHVHPIEHYYTWAHGRVLHVVVSLCLLAWGFLCFSCPSPTQLLVLLLATDLGFILLDFFCGTMGGFYGSDFAITTEWGYAETFQYVKEFGILLFFFVFFLQYPYLMNFGWQIFALYILLDDSLQIHERLGRSIAESLHLSPIAGLPAQDFGELIVSVLVGSLILSLLSVGYYYATSMLRKISRQLFGLLILLTFCGVVLDMVQVMIFYSIPSLYTILGTIEEGGEMVTISLIAWYAHRLTTDWPRHLVTNLTTTENDDALMEEAGAGGGSTVTPPRQPSHTPPLR